jgi:hypothetical protein
MVAPPLSTIFFDVDDDTDGNTLSRSPFVDAGSRDLCSECEQTSD